MSSERWSVVHDGPALTRREWLAAHAPAEPEKWYRAERPQRPVEPTPPAGKAGLCRGWFADPYWDLAEMHPDCAGYVAAANIFWAELDQWERDCLRLRSIGWRYAWADAMLEAAR